MTPYYQHDGITIYHGDCREVLPTLGKFDLLLTDPPYGIGEANGKNKSRGKLAIAMDYGVASWDNETKEVEVSQAISKCRNSIVWGGNYYPMKPSSCWLVWDKKNGDSDFADCELAWTNFKKAVRMKSHLWAGMLRKDNERRDHPTQKPLDVMRWCLSFAPAAQTILDPFMGSGTTLVAAKLEGRQAVGIELEEKYCEIAANRLSQGVLFPAGAE